MICSNVSLAAAPVTVRPRCPIAARRQRRRRCDGALHGGRPARVGPLSGKEQVGSGVACGRRCLPAPGAARNVARFSLTTSDRSSVASRALGSSARCLYELRLGAVDVVPCSRAARHWPSSCLGAGLEREQSQACRLSLQRWFDDVTSRPCCNSRRRLLSGRRGRPLGPKKAPAASSRASSIRMSTRTVPRKTESPSSSTQRRLLSRARLAPTSSP